MKCRCLTKKWQLGSKFVPKLYFCELKTRKEVNQIRYRCKWTNCVSPKLPGKGADDRWFQQKCMPCSTSTQNIQFFKQKLLEDRFKTKNTHWMITRIFRFYHSWLYFCTIIWKKYYETIDELDTRPSEMLVK